MQKSQELEAEVRRLSAALKEKEKILQKRQDHIARLRDERQQLRQDAAHQDAERKKLLSELQRRKDDKKAVSVLTQENKRYHQDLACSRQELERVRADLRVMTFRQEKADEEIRRLTAASLVLQQRPPSSDLAEDKQHDDEQVSSGSGDGKDDSAGGKAPTEDIVVPAVHDVVTADDNVVPGDDDVITPDDNVGAGEGDVAGAADFDDIDIELAEVVVDEDLQASQIQTTTPTSAIPDLGNEQIISPADFKLLKEILHRNPDHK